MVPMKSSSVLRRRDALPPTRKRYASACPAPARDARRRVRALPSPPPRPRTATKWAAHRPRRCDAAISWRNFLIIAHCRRRARRDRRWAQRVATGWRAGSRPTRGRRTVAKGCAAELMAETIARRFSAICSSGSSPSRAQRAALPGDAGDVPEQRCVVGGPPRRRRPGRIALRLAVGARVRCRVREGGWYGPEDAWLAGTVVQPSSCWTASRRARAPYQVELDRTLGAPGTAAGITGPADLRADGHRRRHQDVVCAPAGATAARAAADVEGSGASGDADSAAGEPRTPQTSIAVSRLGGGARRRALALGCAEVPRTPQTSAAAPARRPTTTRSLPSRPRGMLPSRRGAAGKTRRVER